MKVVRSVPKVPLFGRSLGRVADLQEETANG